ncbi:uncharacterized protein LOC111705021 [Eurytemora carolleeae]|uniref:uncharacterized protein LOC111705021 n=1 Tax=Eurytemora carolleeae TaxID=1294199 RepID=UPI000C770207|nr:uncharacterized protein LOC111705021 [Eurytemora carolleeae]|eukprot:XP_023333219.1 uncharacterized protein LOC111705021 [Eurytemora affinis]
MRLGNKTMRLAQDRLGFGELSDKPFFSELIINGGYTSPRMSDTTATSSVTEVADELDSDDSNSTCLSHSSSSPVKQKPSAGRVNGCGLPSVHVPVSLPSHGHRFNIIQKLNMRQTRGKVMERRGGPEMRLFSRLPGRLAFLIRDTVPHSALTAG